MKNKKCLILANGDSPRKGLINKFIVLGYDTIICADGGAETLRRMGITPNIIIGDLDSISADTRKYFAKRCEIIHYPRQSDTDVEKALKYALRNKFNLAVLFGGAGNRLDHSLCNVSVILKYSDRIDVKMIHQKSAASVHSGKVELKTVPGEIVSIFGFDSKTKFISQGLKYPLNNISLPFGLKESASNSAEGDKVELTISGGKALIIRDLKTAIANGFF